MHGTEAPLCTKEIYPIHVKYDSQRIIIITVKISVENVFRRPEIYFNFKRGFYLSVYSISWNFTVYQNGQHASPKCSENFCYSPDLPSKPKLEAVVPDLPAFKDKEVKSRRRLGSSRAGKQGIKFMSPFDDPDADKVSQSVETIVGKHRIDSETVLYLICQTQSHLSNLLLCMWTHYVQTRGNSLH